MRPRKSAEPSTGPPARLLTFTATDWDSDDAWEAFHAWQRARCAYHEEHGWPDGAVRMIIGHREAAWELRRVVT